MSHRNTPEKTWTCPICEKPVAAAAAEESPVFPFCSAQCKSIDLLRWWKGSYAIVEPASLEELMGEAGSGEF